MNKKTKFNSRVSTSFQNEACEDMKAFLRFYLQTDNSVEYPIRPLPPKESFQLGRAVAKLLNYLNEDLKLQARAEDLEMLGILIIHTHTNNLDDLFGPLFRTWYIEQYEKDLMLDFGNYFYPLEKATRLLEFKSVQDLIQRIQTQLFSKTVFKEETHHGEL